MCCSFMLTLLKVSAPSLQGRDKLSTSASRHICVDLTEGHGAKQGVDGVEEKPKPRYFQGNVRRERKAPCSNL
jgi:hypothetical protein